MGTILYVAVGVVLGGVLLIALVVGWVALTEHFNRRQWSKRNPAVGWMRTGFPSKAVAAEINKNMRGTKV